jgi:acyl carrier protein
LSASSSRPGSPRESAGLAGAPAAQPADASDVLAAVRAVLLEGALAGSDPADLQDSTPLITAGVLDSVRTVQLVGELEDRFGVSFEAHEMSVDYLNTIADIGATIRKKLHGA